MDKKSKIYGAYWMQQDALLQMDDRAIGMIGNSLHYATGLDTPENKAFVDAFVKKYKRLPSWFSEASYTASLWTRTAIEAIKGKVEDKDAFLKAMRSATVKAPRGTIKLDAYDNPIQPVYMTRIQKINHPVLGAVLTNVPTKTYQNVSQFWTWKPEDFLKRGPYKR
jgi:branched-chain amino acid transport system substrate-binding protein